MLNTYGMRDNDDDIFIQCSYREYKRWEEILGNGKVLGELYIDGIRELILVYDSLYMKVLDLQIYGTHYHIYGPLWRVPDAR